MSNDPIPTFLSANISSSRLIEESFHSTLPLNSAEGATQLQVSSETGTNFYIGLDDPLNPKHMHIEIHYKVAVNAVNIKKSIINYDAKHMCEFSIIKWTGFPDWTALPSEAMTPYLSIVHHLAVRRAEATIAETGTRGIRLPVPESFGTMQNLEPSDEKEKTDA